MASTDDYLGYVINNYAHTRDSITGTTTDSYATAFAKHVGGYDQTLITVKNTDAGSDSLDLKIQFSEDNSVWFDEQGFTATTGVTLAAGGYEAFASTNHHHFFRARVKATSAGNQATFTVYWNLVQSQ